MIFGFLGTRPFRGLHFPLPASLCRNITMSTPFEFQRLRPYSYSSGQPGREYPETELLKISYDLTGRCVSVVVHTKMIKAGCSQNVLLVNRLLSLYMESGKFGDAQKLFDEITDRDVPAWTNLIMGFARIGSFRVALNLFAGMQMDCVPPNHLTLSSVLKCCSWLNELRNGKSVHGWLLRSGIALDNPLENSLLDFYVKCGAFHTARKLFDAMPEKDIVSWNIMIRAFLRNGYMKEALDLFRRLPSKDVSSWNTIISGQLQNGFEQMALELLSQMALIGPTFNNRTFSIALGLASALSTLALGREIHCRLLRLEILDDHFIRDSLINMYSKCGKMEAASAIYGMVKTSPVACSSMVSGYVQTGKWEEALAMFCDIVRERIMVDPFTLTSTISACANAGLLEVGQQIHARVEKTGHKLDGALASSMIDMYAKCGTLDDARLAFGQASDRNVVLWTALISGCAFHGHGREAIHHFETMLNQGIRPNEVTFVGILTACSHAGLVQEGCKYFSLMEHTYGIRPSVEHFTCMIDLFGRAGRFNEASDFIFKNGISHLSAIWVALLSSCRVHKNFEMGKWASQKLIDLGPGKTDPLILLSNICAATDQWDEAVHIRSFMNQNGVIKQPGQSWVQMKNQVHSFVMGDRSHPQSSETFSSLATLTRRVKEAGYSSDLKQVVQDVEEEQKEELVSVHSEKLAIAYAAMSTIGKTPIRVMKNLRICSDCHSFMKYTSLVLGREIVVRDLHRFHRFKNGCCSCGDYW